MATKTINRGDSLTIDVIIDEDLLSKVEDIWLSVKGDVVAQKTSTEMPFIEIDNIFRCQLTSSYTQKLNNTYPIIVSVQWDDLGVRKSFEAESTILNVKQNHNPSNSDAVSSEPDIEIEVTQGDNGLIASVTLATIYRGYGIIPGGTDEDSLVKDGANDYLVKWAKRVPYESVENFADISASNQMRLIAVADDETTGGNSSLYWFDGLVKNLLEYSSMKTNISAPVKTSSGTTPITVSANSAFYINIAPQAGATYTITTLGDPPTPATGDYSFIDGKGGKLALQYTITPVTGTLIYTVAV